jgi:hypothetical protein
MTYVCSYKSALLCWCNWPHCHRYLMISLCFDGPFFHIHFNSLFTYILSFVAIYSLATWNVVKYTVNKRVDRPCTKYDFLKMQRFKVSFIGVLCTKCTNGGFSLFFAFAHVYPLNLTILCKFGLNLVCDILLISSQPHEVKTWPHTLIKT